VVLAATVTVEHPTDNDVGTKRPDHPDKVAKDLLVSPLFQRLFDAERVAEINRAQEVLFRTVVAMRGEQFLGAEHSERFEKLRTNLVLSALTVCRRDERRAVPLAVGVVRQHRVVLVVGMCRGHHEVADGVELAQHQFERGLSAKLRHRDQTMLSTGGKAAENQNYCD
jgi:hypothetical protein